MYVEEINCEIVVASQCFVDEFEVDDRDVFIILIQANEILLRSKLVIHIEQ